jgi:phosphoribosyl-ATP pyrophosphohydrolase
MPDTILSRLYALLQTRKTAAGEASYVASLYEKGTDKIAEKILEEAAELIAEAKLLDDLPQDEGLQKNIRSEAADLLFHLLVLLAHHNVPLGDVMDVLARRFGTSGHAEKASRPAAPP